jgi:hypothetical protein
MIGTGDDNPDVFDVMLQALSSPRREAASTPSPLQLQSKKALTLAILQFHAVSHRGMRVLPLQVQMHSGCGQRIPTSVCSWWTQDEPGDAVQDGSRVVLDLPFSCISWTVPGKSCLQDVCD